MLNLLDNEKIYDVLDTVKTSIYWKDLDGKYLGCNKYMMEMFGLTSREDIIGKTDFELLDFNVAKECQKNDRTAIEQGFYEGEEIIILANGKKSVYWSIKHPLRDNQGTVVGVAGNSHNMQAELDRQRAILDEKLKVSQIMDVVNASIYWKDLNGAILGCNQHVLNMFGTNDREEIIGKNEYDLLSEEDAIRITKNDRSVLANGYYEGEENFMLPSGENKIYYVVKNRLFDSENNVIGLVGTSLDITAKKEAERLDLEDHKNQMNLEKQQAVLNEQLKISQIIDVVNASIYWKDLNGVMLGCNQYVLDLFGANDRQEIIGKNEYDLMTDEEAIRITEIDRSVLANGYYGGEEIYTSPSGEKKTYYTVKNRLVDSENNVIGMVGTSVDITAQKEAEQLKLENERQQIIIEEKEKFKQNASKVAHDIRSPLTSLLILSKTCTAIPEKERIALREAANRISDIANNLLSDYKEKEVAQTAITEQRESILVSPVLLEILTEKKYQYQQFAVKFDHHFTQIGEFSWIKIQPSAFKRMLSNIINNAVDALDQKHGNITVHLDADNEQVGITIEDDGKGMSPALVQKIMDKIAVTEGKADGHGIGLTQVRDTLQDNQGQWAIDSQVGVGTKIKLTFPCTQSLGWIAEAVELNDNDTVVILDDDSSIHLAWDFRFEKLTKQYPNLILKHFEIGQETIDFINGLEANKKQSIFLLADYELLKQNLNGLDVIEQVQTSRAILVTSHYADKKVQQAAVKAGTQILPKQLASEVPIHVTKANDAGETNLRDSDLKKVDVIFVDDEEYLLDSFKFFASGKKVDTYSDPQTFLDNVTQYHKNTKIMLDQNFANYDRKGNQIAEQLQALGFTRLYLLSGDSFSAGQIPSYLTLIGKGDLNSLTAAING